MGDNIMLIRNAAGLITRAVSGVHSGDRVVTELVSGAVNAIDRKALPIRVRNVRVKNRAGKMVVIPSAVLCHGAKRDRIYIMHSSTGLDCAKRTPDPVEGPRDMLSKLPCQWTWFTTSVHNMWVDEPFTATGPVDRMMQLLAASSRMSTVDFADAEAAILYSMTNKGKLVEQHKHGYTIGIDWAEGMNPIHKEKQMGSGTYDKKVLVEKLTAAMGVHEEALKSAITDSSKRAHEALDTVLATGGSEIVNDITMTTALVKVDDYKDMLEELSLIAGDSVRGADLSRDPLSLIRAAGVVKPLKSRLRMERI